VASGEPLAQPTPPPNNKKGLLVPKIERKEIGLAIVGCGTIGRIRAEIARDYPGVGWIGLCDLKSDLGHQLESDIGADFFTTDYRELLARPEVTATIIATDENFHFEPTMLAIERGHDLFIEKPLSPVRSAMFIRW
jgi:myo-inositol 2-dehydrogenase/D-chiro-inositol 1-dehydrogenase